MARKPENIHVFLYRKNADNEFEYAIFQRSDNPEYWQGISGGIEEGENAEQAALRESFEEAGTPLDMLIYRLDTMSYIPSDVFPSHVMWGIDVVVCPMFFSQCPLTVILFFLMNTWKQDGCYIKKPMLLFISTIKKLHYGN